MTKLLVSCALAAIIFAAAPQVLKAGDTDGQCPLLNATLRGTYMVTGTGTIMGTGPVSAVGTISYNGEGKSVNTFTVSVNGLVYRGVTVTGPYTVNRDCTGTLSQSDGTNYDFVVAPDGSTVFWIETDAGTIVSGTEVRLKHSNEIKESRDRDAVKIPLSGAAIERVNVWRRTGYRTCQVDLTCSRQASYFFLGAKSSCWDPREHLARRQRDDVSAALCDYPHSVRRNSHSSAIG
jgi:hypothetical protein